MPRLNIVLAAPSLSRPGGVARSVARAVRALRAAGHPVTVVSPDEALFPDDRRHEGGDVTFGPRERGGTSPEETARRGASEHAHVLVEEVARLGGRPDIVLGYYATTAGRAAVLAGSELALPAVVAARGNDIDRDLAEGSPLASTVRDTLARAAGVIAVSREMVDKIRRGAGVLATFVTNAVEHSRFFPDPEGARAFVARFDLESSRPVLGVFGELKQKRGLERLGALPDEVLAPFQLLVVGRVRGEVRDLLPRGVRLVPYLQDDADLRGAYCACAALLHPSTMDGMPNVVLEAMACGTPVLVSPVGGLLDLVQDGVTGAICDGPSDWARALADLRTGELAPRAEAARTLVPAPEIERDGILRALQDAMRRYTASSASR